MVERNLCITCTFLNLFKPLGKSTKKLFCTLHNYNSKQNNLTQSLNLVLTSLNLYLDFETYKMFLFFSSHNLMGRDKRAYIAMLRQAKIYPPRQAAAATIHELPQSTRWIIISCGLRQLVDCGSYLQICSCRTFYLVDCSSCIAAAATCKFVAAAIHKVPQSTRCRNPRAELHSTSWIEAAPQ